MSAPDTTRKVVNKDPVLVVSNCDKRLGPKAMEKIFGKHGKILKVCLLSNTEHETKIFRVEFERTDDATHALESLNNKVALGRRLAIVYETDNRGPTASDKIRSIEAKLQLLEHGIEHRDTVGRVMQYAATNGKMFNNGADTTPVWNGLGTTRTKQSPTLFVTNIPREVFGSVKYQEEMDTLFGSDPGFFQVRIVRGMCFVDFESVADATRAMIAHQNHRFPNTGLHRGGLLIDYDKDSRIKRNRAYEKSKQKR
eukprot:m.126241 g.126241  ORF g.126241 m.126241 type:complete len:254 (+) comp17364_c0_seq2:255-1016(+)